MYIYIYAVYLSFKNDRYFKTKLTDKIHTPNKKSWMQLGILTSNEIFYQTSSDKMKTETKHIIGGYI
jgi:hypothetical protein